MHLARTTAADQLDEWLQQEVSCLLCGRLIARLVYPIRTNNVADQRERFVVGHPVAAELRNLRCATCGGSAVFDIAERVWIPRHVNVDGPDLLLRTGSDLAATCRFDLRGTGQQQR